MIKVVESVSCVSSSRKFLGFWFSSEKKLCFKIREINKQAQTKFLFFFFFIKKKIIWIDKLKFKNISIILFQSLLLYEQKTCKNTWKKAGKRKQNFQKFHQIITACRIKLRVQEMTINEKLTVIGLSKHSKVVLVLRYQGWTFIDP